MSESKKNSIPGPFIAVGLIAVIWFGVEFWPSSDDTPPAIVETEPIQEVSRHTPEQVTAPDPVEETNTTVVVENTEYALEGEGWSTYHGGPALTGAIDTTLSDTPELLWRYQADASVYYAPVTSEGRIFFSTLKGGVVALDKQGNELWKQQFFQDPYRDGRPRVERFDAPISSFKSRVFVGSIRGLVYAFDATSGDTKWTFDMGGPVMGTVNFHDPSDAEGDERVFIIEQGEGILHSIDLTNGESLWKTEAIDRCDGSPSVKGDAIVYGSCAAALHVFSATDGTFVKDIAFDEESQVAGGAAIVGDSAYVGSHSGKLFHASLNAGEVIWYNEDSYDEIFETPAVSENHVVFSSYDGSIYTLNRETGKLIWTYETDGVPTAPVIAGDKVVITTDGVLVLLRLETGEEIWSYEISDEASSPAIIDGMIVVGSDDGTVTAFGTPEN